MRAVGVQRLVHMVMAAMRTKRTYAATAFAHAAIPRSCGTFIAAMRHVSSKQPFNAINFGGFQTDLRFTSINIQFGGTFNRRSFFSIQPMWLWADRLRPLRGKYTHSLALNGRDQKIFTDNERHFRVS